MKGLWGESTPLSMKHRSVSSLKEQRPFGNHNKILRLLSTVNVFKNAEVCNEEAMWVETMCLKL